MKITRFKTTLLDVPLANAIQGLRVKQAIRLGRELE